MHEMSYGEAVVAAVERRAKGRRVVRVGVRIGAVHRVVPDAFQQSFELAAAGGVAADAQTEVVTVPVSATCRSCDMYFTSEDPGPLCPYCGGVDVAASGGDEVTLEWLEFSGEAASGEPASGEPAQARAQAGAT
jgi:hydrogenase nickel incorporation protein HypA/HybF